MAVKNQDFIEIEYTGKIKLTGQVFDTNIEKVAKEENIYDEKKNYKPTIICVGKGDVIKGLDEFLVGKEIGKEYTVEIKPEQGFGNYDKKLIKLMPITEFTKNKIHPMPGMQLDFGQAVGTITSVSGGRVMVDFNNPLAGKILEYKVKLNKIITDTKAKIESYLELKLGKAPEFIIDNDKVIIKMELPEQLKQILQKEITERIPEIKHVNFQKKS